MGRQGQHGVKWCKIEVHFYLACQKICLKFELAHWLKMAKGYPSLLLNVSNLTCLVQAAPIEKVSRVSWAATSLLVFGSLYHFSFHWI